MQVAIYTRVSTERQEREQTIESQLAVLRAWAEAHGHVVKPEHVFLDEGYSGARLDRPALDRLRDVVQDGEIGGVVVLSPDRLYANTRTTCCCFRSSSSPGSWTTSSGI